MSVSPTTQPNKIADKLGITKHSYFASGNRLYYILDASYEGDIFYVEDCLTNQARWWSLEEFMRVKKRKVNFTTKGGSNGG